MGVDPEAVVEALRRSERRYRSLVENIPGSVIILFDRELRIVLVDGPEVEASGASKAGMEGKLPRECLPPEFAEVVERNFQAVIDGGRFSMELPWKDLIYHYEYVPLRDERGEVEHGLVVGQNVTRQHRAEAALRASEQRFRALFETAPDAFVLQDLEGRFLDGNHAAQALFGLDRQGVVGKSLFEVGTFALSARPVLAAALEAIRAGRATGPLEVAYLRRDGAELNLEIKSVPLQLPDGAPVCLVAVRDVTERRQLEMQLHHAMKMDAIGRLAGGIAHDFNNMLSAILGNIELAMTDLEPRDPRRADLDEAVQAARRAAGLVAQLLAFSRKQEIKPAVVELNELIAGCTRMLGRLLGAPVNVVAKPSPDPVSVRVDAGKLEQVLVNLAINARDAMPTGGVLTFATEIVPALPEGLEGPAGPHARLQISDTGTGMSADTLAHLFEPFFTTKPPGQGTGLGLSIVYGIVTQSEGHIRVRSHQGRGTTFEILLPLATAEVPRPAPALAAPAPVGAGRVLVVDDDEQVLRTIEGALRRQGYDPMATTSTDEALAYASDPTIRIDLLVADLTMPKLDGIALRERLVGSRPDLPILFISGDAEPALLSRANDGGHTWFLAKPFSIDEMIARVRAILGDAINAPASAPPA